MAAEKKKSGLDKGKIYADGITGSIEQYFKINNLSRADIDFIKMHIEYAYAFGHLEGGSAQIDKRLAELNKAKDKLKVE